MLSAVLTAYLMKVCARRWGGNSAVANTRRVFVNRGRTSLARRHTPGKHKDEGQKQSLRMRAAHSQAAYPLKDRTICLLC